ncbi:hypothetical protein [Streptomyces sp. NBC_01477]|uniref:hypothetical protein n=1 Tax=Streptomyces sp. NBC_01477 TaxID=2976015 RepID=UPI002E34D02A|nr:hypothetical protein [Streptomyces sp. NBC_01477]
MAHPLSQVERAADLEALTSRFAGQPLMDTARKDVEAALLQHPRGGNMSCPNPDCRRGGCTTNPEPTTSGRPKR